MKRVLALLLAPALILAGCSAPAESAEGNFNTQVDKKQLISERAPANNATVSLVSKDVEKFIQNYSMGKGLIVADNTRKEDLAVSVPVTLSWTCDKDNTGFTVIYTTQQDFSDAVKVDVTEPKLELADLFVATTYYWQVVTHTSSGDNYSTVFCFTTADTPRIISIDGVNNARDVGGYLTEDGRYRVAQGMVYRGTRLNDYISEEGIEKALSVYKFKTELDLRRKTDNGYSDVTPLGETVNYVNISVIDYSGAYSHQEEMRQAIALLADESCYPIYVHCTAGRDRTGTMLFIVGALLGVPEQSLCADFELTYLTGRSYAKGDLTGHEAFLKFLKNFKEYEGETLQQKAESYCKSIGVTDAEIQAIRANLLKEV